MAGDDVLRAIAGITASCVREGDVVYRFGGEELCILLPGAADDEALAVAERVRTTVAARAFPGGETQPGGRVTVSAGVARAGDPEAAALVVAAEAALYRARREGRDRVVAAG
jgi:diguanylate cyclase (GGDEF)-like protein